MAACYAYFDRYGGLKATHDEGYAAKMAAVNSDKNPRGVIVFEGECGSGYPLIKDGTFGIVYDGVSVGDGDPGGTHVFRYLGGSTQSRKPLKDWDGSIQGEVKRFLTSIGVGL